MQQTLSYLNYKSIVIIGLCSIFSLHSFAQKNADGTYSLKTSDGKTYIYFPTRPAAGVNPIDTLQVANENGGSQFYFRERDNGQVVKKGYTLNKIVDASNAEDGTFINSDPEFVGGEEALFIYLKRKIVYPKNACKNNIEGPVLVRFIVNETGMVSDVSAVSFPAGGEDLAKEAVRVVNAMPPWKPAIVNGRPARQEHSITITFTPRR